MGANLFRDLFAGIRDIVGGRSGAYEKELRNGLKVLTGGKSIYGLLGLENVPKHERRLL